MKFNDQKNIYQWQYSWYFSARPSEGDDGAQNDNDCTSLALYNEPQRVQVLDSWTVLVRIQRKGAAWGHTMNP
jgi:hypothetical protein